MESFLLASASPRRKEILSYFSFPFEQVHHNADERSVPWNGNPIEYVEKLASIKSEDVSQHYPNRSIIAADTIVVCEGHICHKPENKEACKHMLQSLAGKQHEVFTAISLIHAGSHAVRSERTSVFMNSLTPQQIDQYLSTNLWSDKAGGYAIQNIGSLLVQRIDGCFYNVVGLPISLLHSMLLAHGIDMWTFV